MGKIKHVGRIIAFDTLAVICFIGVILFGWIPGPGGIPLFLLGLSLLAANHDWAERLLETSKIKGVTFKKVLFPNKPWVRRAYDVLTVIAMLAGAYLIVGYDSRITNGFGVALTCFALFIFLLNRDRFDKISDYVKKLKS